jgi:8-oxo-dGTP pyrophosphatase MutT (NUDIX family)
MSAERGPDIRMLSSAVVYEDHWMRLRRDDIERRDGSRGTYAYVEKRDFALVIPAENDGFHLVEEYRYPIRRRTWSFPQGGWPNGESGSPEELARLELSQETGLRARDVTRLGLLHCAHGITNQVGHFYDDRRGPHHRRLHPGRLRPAADPRAPRLTPSYSSGPNRSPWPATRSRTASAVKNRSSTLRHDSTSSQLTGVETVGWALARSE